MAVAGSSVSDRREALVVAVFLALLGGFLDSYTYLLKGGVFANAQTGNLVLMAVELAKAQWWPAGRYLLPILFYALGILGADLVKRLPGWTQHRRGIVLVLIGDAVLIGILGVTSPWIPFEFTTCAISLFAAVQVAVFNKVEGAAVATTMITGNLRSAMEALTACFLKRDAPSRRRLYNYLSVIGAFAVGAAVGAWLVTLFRDAALFFCWIFVGGASLALARRP